MKNGPAVCSLAAGHRNGVSQLSTPVPVQEALALLRATFEVDRPDLLAGDLYLRIYGNGLFLVNLPHVVHIFKRTEIKQHSSINGRIVSVLFNPETSTSYETAAMDLRSSDLFQRPLSNGRYGSQRNTIALTK